MFFKLTLYATKTYAPQSGYDSSPGNIGIGQLNGGQFTVYVNTEEIKRLGMNDGNYQYFIEFKSAPIPFSSQTFFVYNQGTQEYNSLKEMANYIEGTEKF